MNRTIFNTISNSQYLRLLQKCSTMDQFKQIHAQIITHGLARFTFITSKLLAFSATSDIDYARMIFNQISLPTIFDYNSIISGYSKTSKQEMGILVYTQMRNNGIEPNDRTFPVLIKACHCESSLLQVYGQIVKHGNVSDVYLTSSLITMYSNFKAVQWAKQVFEESSYKNVVCCTSLITGCFNNGLVDEARKVFDEMPERNDVSYSAMISGFVRNELFNEAIELFLQLTNYGLAKPNRSLLLSILNACGAVGALDVGKSIRCQLVEDSFGINLELGTALIDFYAKCGDVDTAHDIFSRMPHKDVATWSAMVLGLATNGKNEMAIKLFEEMEQKGPVPNDITFVSVLVACNHKTLAKRAWWFLGKMSKVYSVKPVIEHYGCMVDLLTRSGQLKGAQILIKLMPMAPDGAIWGSFLHGCLIHSETHLAEGAGKRLIELEPQHSGRYVLLANMYADIGSWESVIRLRNMMADRKVATAPGWSFIEVDGIVHKFFVDDQCHPRARDLHEVLQVLNKASLN
ncbi:pentatricopeptide repeat-containing protein At5g06540-like [Cynara cardunculus var. scolymus]|uniref:pentatricopeptide repeat-containing protein At5g06540-like n=1 Tax=Cynara cardunculus var. scolymus TaxID=59895 RepID=UPI000D630483|nr:pentatricopeptide repeat-containing protein At5g06540-like [Cynara cardunculus var. scolymus]